GYSVSAFHKTCKRHPEFRLAANRARNTYRAMVAEDLHESEAYARMLVDAVQRDEALPASLRLRAALAILNRKPGRWLPDPIRTPDDPMDTVDNVDTFDALAELAYRQLLTKFPDEEDFSQPDDPNPARQGTHGDPARNAIDTVDIVDTADIVDTRATADTIDSTGRIAVRGAVDTVDKVDTAPNPAAAHLSASQPSARAADNSNDASVASAIGKPTPHSIDNVIAAYPSGLTNTTEAVDTVDTVGQNDAPNVPASPNAAPAEEWPPFTEADLPGILAYLDYLDALRALGAPDDLVSPPDSRPTSVTPLS
ncbi:MAG: hypothetical protein LC114_26620, partial [Bryobacterales bacterium]|nr:hypothetical protein [Bryobacterales bacterium]